MDQSDDWITWIDAEARLRFANAAFCRALGYSTKELLALHAWDIYPTCPDRWRVTWAEMKRRVSRTFMLELRAQGGGVVLAESRIKLVTLDNRDYLLCCGRERAVGPEPAGEVHEHFSADDATARRKAAHWLSQLSGRLLQMQDEERRRIARELHDATGQNLGALSINLSMILANSSGLDPQTRERLEQCLALAGSSAREIRTMSYLLHPPLLDEMGLDAALRGYIDGYSERTGIRIDLDLPPRLGRLHREVEVALFRIVQEGLANIHRHSGSRKATLRLMHHANRVELELADFGRGLPPGTLEGDMASASRIGVGIAGMRERARQLGGRLTIASSQAGTTLQVVLPDSHEHTGII